MPPARPIRRLAPVTALAGASLLALAFAGCTSPGSNSSAASPTPAASTEAASIPEHKGPIAAVDVLTQRGDTRRSAVNLQEARLHTGNVNSKTFGRLFSREVDGDIYAQPLYLSALKIGGKQRNVVIVATQNNSVYAFDADDPAASKPLWHVSLGRAVSPDDIGRAPYGIYRDFQTTIGITATPVIDRASGTMYLTGLNKDKDGKLRHRLHALDITTGKHVISDPVEIKATIPGKGVGSVNGKLSFNPHTSNQRSSFLLDRGVIYFAFGSHADIQPYHGWVMAYDAKTLKQRAAWSSTPDGEGGGVWMAGAGLSVDPEGNVYFAVGDGTFTAQKGGRDYGDSFVKMHLTPKGFEVLDYFTPFNQAFLNERDKDLGSCGAILPPGTDYILSGSKAGRMYLMDQKKMGKFNPKDDSQILSSVDVTSGNIYGSPILWTDPIHGPTIFVWGGYDVLEAYRLDASSGHIDPKPAAQGKLKAPNGKPGGILAVSSDGAAPGTGIVWAYLPIKGNANRMTVPGVLRAYDASDVTKELWNSEEVPDRDSIGMFGKFCTPTVANGKVYVGTFSKKLHVYGLLP